MAIDTKIAKEGIWARMGKNRFGRALQYGLGDMTGFAREGVFTVNPAKATRMKGLFGRGMGPAIMLASAAYGYSQDGFKGMATSLAIDTAYSVAPRMIGALLGGAAGMVAGGAILAYGIGTGGYALGQAAQNKGRSLRGLELGGGQIMDAIGSSGAATMRQRSLSALQNTHLNGRMAMGNEAILLHRRMR